jgi:hypothetical protein
MRQRRCHACNPIDTNNDSLCDGVKSGILLPFSLLRGVL